MSNPRPAVRPRVTWAPVRPDGAIAGEWIRPWRMDAAESLGEFFARRGEDDAQAWSRMRNDGWRIIRVDITEHKP